MEILKRKFLLPCWLLILVFVCFCTLAFFQFQHWQQEQQAKGENKILTEVISQKDNQIKAIQILKTQLYDSLAQNQKRLESLQKNTLNFNAIDVMPIDEQIKLLRSKHPEAFTNP